MSNSYYFGCSQSYCLYQKHIYLYQVPKGKQNGTSIDTINSILGWTDKGKYKTNLIYLKWGKIEPKYVSLNQYDKTTY